LKQFLLRQRALVIFVREAEGAGPSPVWKYPMGTQIHAEPLPGFPRPDEVVTIFRVLSAIEIDFNVHFESGKGFFQERKLLWSNGFPLLSLLFLPSEDLLLLFGDARFDWKDKTEEMTPF
jgi:hypothetical protein